MATGGGFDPNAPTTGEIYDAQREQPGWNTPAFDDAGWANAISLPAPTGVLQAMDVEPIRVTGELPAPVVSEISPGLYLYDFQTTRAGWATVSMEGPPGATVTMKYAEKLKEDGTVDNESGFGGSPALQRYICHK